jgi:DNA-binding CsgD family transcriptional regulator
LSGVIRRRAWRCRRGFLDSHRFDPSQWCSIVDEKRTTTHPEPPQETLPERAAIALVGVEGSGAGRVFVLSTRQTLVGKADGSDIRLTDTGVSRQHAKLLVAADKTVTLFDLASTNGTYLNDTRIELAQVRPGDIVRFGPAAKFRLAHRVEVADQPTAPAIAPSIELSTRQLEVAQLAAQGLTNAVIAERLAISPLTVKSHLDHIYNRLGLGNRTALTVWLTRAGLL